MVKLKYYLHEVHTGDRIFFVDQGSFFDFFGILFRLSGVSRHGGKAAGFKSQRCCGSARRLGWVQGQRVGLVVFRLSRWAGLLSLAACGVEQQKISGGSEKKMHSLQTNKGTWTVYRQLRARSSHSALS